MTNQTYISVTSTAESALKKLKKENIPVFNCKKQGIYFKFYINDKHIKKVFAIFQKPCYNINIENSSPKIKFKITLLNRIGLFLGILLFALSCTFSQLFIFRISVKGNGSYLTSQVKQILYANGGKGIKLFSSYNLSVATSQILSLPSVTFCNIKKVGGVLVVDIRTDSEHNSKLNRLPLKSTKKGIVKQIVAICGTEGVNVGDSVDVGENLILPYTLINETKYDCIAVGYVELECKGKLEYKAQEESEENLKIAYSTILLYADKVVDKKHAIKTSEEGVIYIIDFTYLQKLSINME